MSKSCFFRPDDTDSDGSEDIYLGLGEPRSSDPSERKASADECQEHFKAGLASSGKDLMLVGLLREMEPTGPVPLGVMATADIPEAGTMLWAERALALSRSVESALCSKCRKTAPLPPVRKGVTERWPAEVMCEECDISRHKLFCERVQGNQPMHIVVAVDMILQATCRLFHARSPESGITLRERDKLEGDCCMLQHLREHEVYPSKESIMTAVMVKNSFFSELILSFVGYAREIVNPVIKCLWICELWDHTASVLEHYTRAFMYNRVRCFTGVVEGGQERLAFGIASAFLEHSCEPNAVLILDQKTMVLRTIRPISAGERVTISRVNEFSETRDRMRDLWTKYGLWCNCQRCASVPLSGMHLCTGMGEFPFTRESLQYWQHSTRFDGAAIPMDYVNEKAADVERLAAIVSPRHPYVLKLRLGIFQIAMLAYLKSLQQRPENTKLPKPLSTADCVSLLADLNMMCPPPWLAEIPPVVLADMVDLARAM